MSTFAAAMLLVAAGSGPAGSAIAPRLAAPFDANFPEGQAIGAAERADEVRRLCALFAQAPRQFPTRGLPTPVRLAFVDPFGLPEIARWTTDPAAHPGDRPFRAVAQYAARAWGVNCPVAEERSTYRVTNPQQAIHALDFLLNEPSMIVRRAIDAVVPPPAAEPFGPPAPNDVPPPTVDRAKVARVAIDSAQGSTGRSKQLSDALGLAMQASAAIDRAALVRAAGHLDEAIAVEADWSTFPAVPLPAELAGAVEGGILAAQLVPELGWLVVGGPGPNRYDMTRVAAVFDPAGDDRYDWGNGLLGNRMVIDIAGNDVYAATRGTGGTPPLSGPAGAAFGVCVIDDWAGNDRYECAQAGIGAAVFGIGILVDRGGDDVYAGGAWTVGAAFAGIGALCDLGGNDLYVSDIFSQGCGGPGGAALLLDAAGDDRYRADGTVPSAYGTPTVHCSFSQGVGFGYRAGAAGGVGALVDLAGNDRYEAGEFGQGCGYFLSMGILRDAGGNDLYYGNRYAQGTAAHQAFGALLDDAGDDLYWSMTAAGQGAAWDMSAAVLVDRAGDDRYQAEGLSQGAAAQQAIGMLLDLGGRDDYRAGGDSQGAAGGNDYHWDATRCVSVGMLRDLAGPNRFDAGRQDGERRVSGDPAAALGRGSVGVFLAR